MLSFAGSSVSNAVALSNGGASSSSSSVYSDSFGGSSQSKATAVAGFSSQAPPLGLFNSDFGPYKSLSSNFAQANAQSFSNGGNSYGQGLKPYPFSNSYPYDSESNSAQAQSDSGYFPTVPLVSPNNKGYSANQPSAIANRESYQTIGSIETKVRSDDRLYRSDPVFLSNVSPYGQEKSFTQGQPYIDNGLYRSAPLASSVSNPYDKGLSVAKPQALADSEPSQSVAEPNLSPYREGPNFDDDLYQPEFLPSSVSNPNGQDKRLVQTPDSESQILIEPLSVQSKLRNPDSLSYPFNEASSISQGLKPTDIESSRPTYYYDTKMRPYDPILKSNGFSSQNEIYQAVPIPNPPYDSFMVPYIGPNSANPPPEKGLRERFSVPDKPNSYTAPEPYSQGSNRVISYGNGLNSGWDNVPYQAVPFPDPYDSFMVPYKENNPILPDSNLKPYDSVPKQPNLGWNSASGFPLVPRGPKLNAGSAKVQNAFKPISKQGKNSVIRQSRIPLNIRSRSEVDSASNELNSTSSDYESSDSSNMVRSGPESAQDDTASDENRKFEGSNADRNAYALSQYPPNDPYPQLYPSGADAVYGDLKVQGASDAVYPISKKPNPYANDYPAELIAYQPTDYSQPDKQLTSSLFTGEFYLNSYTLYHLKIFEFSLTKCQNKT